MPLRNSRSWPPPISSGSNACRCGDEHADALRATELVRRQRHEIDVGSDAAQIEPARRLHGVGVHHRLRSDTVDDGRNIGEIGDRANLVVDGHDRNHGHIGPANGERIGQVHQVDASGVVDTDDASPSVLDGLQHGVVLDGRAQRHAAPTIERAEDRRVVGLGAPAGEDHLAGVTPTTSATSSRASSIDLRTCRAKRCEPDGLANCSVRNGSIASTASARIGVVAAWSR